jgi:hypothetical protein
MLQRAEQAARPLAQMLEHITIRPLAAPLNALQPGNRYVQRNPIWAPTSLPATPTREIRPKSLDAWAATPALMLFYGGIQFGCASRISGQEAILPVGMWQRERHAPQALRRYRFRRGGARGL